MYACEEKWGRSELSRWGAATRDIMAMPTVRGSGAGRLRRVGHVGQPHFWCHPGKEAGWHLNNASAPTAAGVCVRTPWGKGTPLWRGKDLTPRYSLRIKPTALHSTAPIGQSIFLAAQPGHGSYRMLGRSVSLTSPQEAGLSPAPGTPHCARAIGPLCQAHASADSAIAQSLIVQHCQSRLLCRLCASLHSRRMSGCYSAS